VPPPPPEQQPGHAGGVQSNPHLHGNIRQVLCFLVPSTFLPLSMEMDPNGLIGATMTVTTTFFDYFFSFSLTKLTFLIELIFIFLHNLIRNLYKFILGNFEVI
jgi:hypothetical protein